MRAPSSWDETTDVLVVGGGPAGFAAATSAARAGAAVLLAERRAVLGGNAPLSSGYGAFAGTGFQREHGVDDDAERFVGDMRAEAERWARRGPAVFDEPVARRYAERSASTADALVAAGVGFRALVRRKGKHSRDRMHALDRVTDLPATFARALGEAGVVVRHSLAAERLFSDGERVVGARLRAGDGPHDVGAEAVVLAGGGFQGDRAMRALHHPPHLSRALHLGIASASGDAHRMAAAAGAQLVNMSLLSAFPIVATALIEHAIAIDRDGERFHDESDPFTTAHALQAAGGEGFYVFDARAARERASYLRVFPSLPVSAETLEGLAHRIGVSAPGLARTVATWNDAARTEPGTDPQFGRGSFDRRGITEPPFHAARIEIGINVTYGGVRVDADMRALDPWGEPIPGVFAVGDCAGSLAPVMELGGMHLGAALALGAVAGERAATAPRLTQGVAP